MNDYHRADRFIMAGFVAAFIGFLYLAMQASERRTQRWNAFVKAHQCRVVERRAGDVDTTVLPIVNNNGSVSLGTGFSFEDDKIAYLCDDGVKYWR